MKLLEHKQLTWGFKAEADEGTAGRAIQYPRGRVLGGSSSPPTVMASVGVWLLR
ncbi:MAG: hypothetical protein JO001_17990 [Alphaproteobacteria bacterium]|nr:hypothetical protein [Alphaproteobacteria bacterium]